MTKTGTLTGPIAGLKYETPSHVGLTNERGEFQYEEDERVAFLVGSTAIGNVTGRPRVTLANIVARVDGDINKLKDPGVTNIARLVFTLGRSDIRDHGTDIPPEVHDLIGDRALNFRHDVNFEATTTLDKVQQFTQDPVIVELIVDLNRSGIFAAGSPRELCTPANARNELRRNAMGILRFRDVKIPLENGEYVLADVFRPAEPGTFPVIITCGPYGKAFNHHSIATYEDLEKHELMEEDYFLGNSMGLQFENHETANTAVWVPDGYAVVRVDMPGTGNNPGQVAPWGIAGAQALHDSIEWAGEQRWSNGNVGTWGMSYLAMTQHQAASLHPKHLKAMIAIGTDVDLYEEVAYSGGIFNEQFWSIWKASGIVPAGIGEPDIADFTTILKNTPFRDSDPEAAFGPRANVFMSPDLSDVTIPLWAVAATTHVAHFHQLGGSGAYLGTPTSNKKLDFWEDWFQKAYAAETVASHKAFFDHWLKGIDNKIMDLPPVRLEIRTGNGASFVLQENEWPVARTNYTRWYLDATPADWAGSSARSDFLQLSTSESTVERQGSYSAEVTLLPPGVGAAIRLDPDSPESAPQVNGISFISEPLTEDAVLAGYGKAGLWVSSTAADMDIYVSVRAVDEDGREVDYTSFATMGFGDRPTPLMKGWLKASHRTLDFERSTEYSPKHTHRKADYAPLVIDEVVPVEIELIPNTGLVRKGQRIRVDIQPYDGVAHGMHHAYDPGYHDGATNTVYTGPGHVSYVQLPIIPR
ncbi:CocE/NonD family hydrolase [Paenarthrobacter sp. PH39-S1]|uniref:CocE/NonD family hydrolase n=1 Tax=Paenarthrobacter sp. PH39-S1 TaxID=3046204 RepID=UPI0024B8E109|nr:CocE/NonD family hydrolase [Paenarthrobacter sp. PH39-S1]MDJ0358298.1 CocE/NonD family hydrolase [Paenarthrobacter sp. PH39-S1]